MVQLLEHPHLPQGRDWEALPLLLAGLELDLLQGDLLASHLVHRKVYLAICAVAKLLLLLEQVMHISGTGMALVQVHFVCGLLHGRHHERSSEKQCLQGGTKVNCAFSRLKAPADQSVRESTSRGIA